MPLAVAALEGAFVCLLFLLGFSLNGGLESFSRGVVIPSLLSFLEFLILFLDLLPVTFYSPPHHFMPLFVLTPILPFVVLRSHGWLKGGGDLYL